MKIITICGSVKFKEEMLKLRDELMPETWVLLPENMDVDIQKIDINVKSKMDDLHFKKIELADEVLVVNVGGYIGQSTALEISYAKSIGKPIKFLNDIPDNDEKVSEIKAKDINRVVNRMTKMTKKMSRTERRIYNEEINTIRELDKNIRNNASERIPRVR